MYQKFYLFCVFNSWMLLLTVQDQASGIPTICYDSSREGKILAYFAQFQTLVTRYFVKMAYIITV